MIRRYDKNWKTKKKQGKNFENQKKKYSIFQEIFNSEKLNKNIQKMPRHQEKNRKIRKKNLKHFKKLKNS